jgi:predicted O-linked N-acetylglucosamine transferase (SPINDLY family)
LQSEIADKIALARKHFAAREFEQAEAIARQVLIGAPSDAAALQLLGMLALVGQKPQEALELLQRSAALAPGDLDTQLALGNTLVTLGEGQKAIAVFGKVLATDAKHPAALFNLGIAQRSVGDTEGAIATFERFTAVCPDVMNGQLVLAELLHKTGRHELCIAAYERARALGSLDAESHYRLGVSLNKSGRLDGAIENFRQAIALRHDYLEAFNALGTALSDRGEAENAMAIERAALQINPDLPGVHSNLLCSLHYVPGADSTAILSECRAWDDRHARPLGRLIEPYTNERNADRRLRIAYVSPDFRGHAQSLFTQPLLAQHDHKQFEVFCFSSTAAPDQITRHLRGFADQWRDTSAMSDQQIADLIREDGIDIAVDLAMHMSGGRLLVFARKPAPVQVTWLAYAGTTGLGAMDWRLGDPYLDPPGPDGAADSIGPHDRFYSERTYRLPHTFWCYDPAWDLAVNELPASAAGHVVFGSLNNFCKVNPPLLRRWGKVLAAVPGSRMLLHAPQGLARQRVSAALEAEGVEPSRVEFVPRQPRPAYLQTYHRIDIGLDTLPYNGATTSLDSYWMGVPVITLVGQTSCGRAGLSQLTNLGLTQLVAQSEAEFVSIARDLAADLPRLAELRRTLRARMEASPLMDAKSFARGIEAAYRHIWRLWCAGPA